MTARNFCLLGLLATPLAAQLLEPPALLTAARSIELEPSTDVKLKFHFLAIGKQIYQCDNGAWAKASTPDAALYDLNSRLKVRHGAGPTWTMWMAKAPSRPSAQRRSTSRRQTRCRSTG